MPLFPSAADRSSPVGPGGNPKVMIRAAQVNRKSAAAFLAVALSLPLGGTPVRAETPADEPPPSAREILQAVRFSQRGRDRAFPGRLRVGPTVIPLRLELAGDIIRYRFLDRPETLTLYLGEDAVRLELTADGRTRAVAGERWLEPVRGTDLTYEDLALGFLYWTNAAVVGEDILLTRRCLKLELHPPRDADSQYGTVWAWIEKKSGALLRAEGYRRDGTLATRFSVISGQVSDGEWFLKRLRIERMEQGRPRDQTPTYLELEPPE